MASRHDYRDRDRDRDRDRWHPDQRDRDRDRDRPRHDEHDHRDGYNDDSRGRNMAADQRLKVTEQEPTNVIILRGLNFNTTLETLRDVIYGMNYQPLDVRLVKNKDTGESRGFAFIDFRTVMEASKVIEDCHRYPLILDGREIAVSFGKAQVQPSHEPPRDWICPQCNGQNFARREQCYLCQMTRPANAATVPSNAGGAGGGDKEGPSPVLVVRGLDLLTSEEVLWSTFGVFGTVKEVRLIRDKTTKVSRGFAFVEFQTQEEASNALRRGNGLKIDNAVVRISYSRRGENSAASSGLASEILQQAQWSTAGAAGAAMGMPPMMMGVPMGMMGYPMAYDPVAYAYASQLSYPPGMAPPGAPMPQAPPANAAPAGAPLASDPSVDPDMSAFYADISASIAAAAPVKNPPPGPVPMANAVVVAAKPAAPAMTVSKPREKPKDPAKDKQVVTTSTSSFKSKKLELNISKWNKKVKELNEEEKHSVEAAVAAAKELVSKSKEKEKEREKEKEAERKEAESAENVTAGLGSTAAPPTPAPATQTIQPIGKKPQTVDDVVIPESEQVAGLICVLCKRQFQSLEILHKHVAQSDLHKQNLEAAKQRKLAQLQEAREKKQRDREEIKAASSGPPKPAPLMSESNVGFKLMKGMGWKEGEGLGRDGDGITAPIAVEMRAERAGLGLPSSSSAADYSGDNSYAAALKRRFRQRFDELTEEEKAKRQKDEHS